MLHARGVSNRTAHDGEEQSRDILQIEEDLDAMMGSLCDVLSTISWKQKPARIQFLISFASNYKAIRYIYIKHQSVIFSYVP